MKESENSVEQLQSWVDASESATYDARLRSERDRDYFHGHQLTAAERKELQDLGQPPVVINKVRRKVEWLAGLEIQQRTDPRAYPRTPDHEDDAEAATDAIRYVCDNADWDQVRTGAYDEMLVEGFGASEVIHKQKADGSIDIVLNHVPWDRVFYDAHSRKHDFSDARYKGMVIWTDSDLLKKEYPDHEGHFEGLIATSAGQETYDDRPKHDFWVDASRKRVKVVLIWYKEKDAWYWCKFVHGAKLETGVSPYKDEDGFSECPLILQSAYIDRDNNRYGMVRDLIDPQDEVNKRRSKALHQFSTRQVIMTKGAVHSVAELKREMKKPDGIMEIDITDPEDRFEIVQNGDLSVGQVNLYQDAKQEIDDIGVSGEMMDGGDKGQSGRAILAKQQAGIVGVTPLTDRLSHFTRSNYRQIWNRVRQFWTEEKWVRITDDEKNVKFVGLNQPITLMERLGEMEEQEAAMVAREYQLRPNDPRLQATVGVRNNVAEMDVDILIEEAPDMITLAGEKFEAMLKYGPTIPPKALIELDPNMPRQQKDKLIELLDEQMQQQAQAQQPAMEMEMADKQADIQKKQADAAKTATETQLMTVYGR